MSFFTLLGGLPQDASKPSTSTDILPGSNWFEMFWVDARPVPAQVVNEKTLRYRPNESLERRTWRSAHFSVYYSDPVATFVLGTQPIPTTSRRISQILTFKLLFHQ